MGRNAQQDRPHLGRGDGSRDRVAFSGHTELVAWAASHKVDLGAVHRQLDRALGLATDREPVELFKDCEPGALPPLGLAYGIDTILDQSLVDAPDIYFEAGDSPGTGSCEWQRVYQVNGQRAARSDQPSCIAIEQKCRISCDWTPLISSEWDHPISG